MRRFVPPLPALYAFEAAGRHLNFTKAGRDLGLTQSAVSRHVLNLESFLSTELFQRTGSRLVLTERGSIYFDEVSALLDKLQEISMDVVRGRTIAANLMIGATTSISSRWVMPRLSRFIAAHGEVPIELTGMQGEIDFTTTRLDVVVLRGAGTWSEATVHALFAEQLAVVAAPSLISPGTVIEPADVSRFHMLQNASRPALWKHWMRLGKVHHSGSIQGPRFASSDLLVQAALRGMGIAVVPSCYIEAELQSGTLHMPFGSPMPSGESFYVAYPNRKAHLPHVKVARDWLIAEARAYNATVGRQIL